MCFTENDFAIFDDSAVYFLPQKLLVLTKSPRYLLVAMYITRLPPWFGIWWLTAGGRICILEMTFETISEIIQRKPKICVRNPVVRKV